MRSKKWYIGTNTKMYKTIADTVGYLKELSQLTADIDREKLELFVIPSFTALDAAGKAISSDMIRLGAQNMCWEDQGQFTGEISPLMLKEVGVEIVEIGHSERRHILGETDEMENRKVLCALRHGFTPLLCIGETKFEKDMGISDEILRTQIKVGLHGVNGQDAKNIWVVYEPVWAIGANGIPPAKEYAQEKLGVIRNVIAQMFGTETAEHIPLLYGGNVNAGNAVGLLQMEDADGLFIGRSALNAGEFARIIRDVLQNVMF